MLGIPLFAALVTGAVAVVRQLWVWRARLPTVAALLVAQTLAVQLARTGRLR
jgi:hypothetical protein